jgi:hypothetical protein
MTLPKLDVPTYELKLLSKDKIIRFRPFLVKEQKLLMMAVESTDSKDILNAVKQICKNCILDELNIDTLPIFDLEHIFLNLRARSINEIVNLQYKCNNKIIKENGEEDTCNSIEKYKLNLLEIQPQYGDNHDRKIMFNDKMGVVMNYPNFEILSKIKSQDEDQIVIELLMNCIDYVFDEEQIYYAKDCTEEELKDFIDSLQQKDLQKIQHFFDTAPKLKHDIHFQCKKCGYKEDIEVEGLQNFFV